MRNHGREHLIPLIADVVKQAKQDGTEWVLIDTPQLRPFLGEEPDAPIRTNAETASLYHAACVEDRAALANVFNVDPDRIEPIKPGVSTTLSPTEP